MTDAKRLRKMTLPQINRRPRTVDVGRRVVACDRARKVRPAARAGGWPVARTVRAAGLAER